ncbi:tetratricopeptide repeat protein [Vibrio algivorus]|uniref:Sel1 repeat family protein n=1 Tax=Vibrio algivorus TaxID=1667024 RepID=A0A557NYB9_9VIBR|nr:sel1 repeat family protein [Vibrio algivorus]TVO33400.1 sel1 repeat family protein [Vibrio algivorus]
MPRYLKLSISILLCIFTLGLMGCNDYTPNPEDDIALFQPFIDANINKKSDDPYISSTVKPGDKLYDILVNIQHGRHDVAIKQLKPLVDKGDADVQFWYAKMIFDSSVKNRYPALQLYKKSAEQGNPNAYFELSPFGEGCLVYFGEKNCTQESLTKAIELFKQKAKQGDLRAQYFLLRMLKPDGSVIEHETYFSNNYNFTHSAESRQHYIKEVIRFAENHYYQPLMDYVDTILTFDRNKNEYVFSSKKLEKLVVQLLTVGVNNNYIPAVELLVALNRSDLNEDDALYQKLNKLGGTEYLASRFYDFEQSYTRKELACYALMFKDMTGNTKFFTWIKNRPSDEELESFNCQSDEKLKEMTPMVYIDGFTSRDKWVD